MSTVTIVSSCESTGKAHEGYDRMAVRLMRSLRRNSAGFGDAAVMWYGEDCPPSERRRAQLHQLGCDLVAGPCQIPEHRLHNKITAMAQVSARATTDYTLWLDSDIYVLGALDGILDGDPDVATSPTEYVHHKWAAPEDKPHWDVYYAAIGMENPNRTIRTAIDNLPGIFYLCSGVVLFRNGIGFTDHYAACAAAVLGTDVPRHTQNFTQTALTLAVVRGGYKHVRLDEKYQRFWALRRNITPDTLISHYQDNRVQPISSADWDVE